MVLILATIAAIAWANSPWTESYHHLSHTYVGFGWTGTVFKLSLAHWIKDGLMAIFFFVVGLEIKRELAVGELSSLRRAALPVTAACGGAIIPAVLFLVLNFGGDAQRGWGIPMATDIAFALGVLSLLGSRVPLGLKVFVTALAIADDVLAVLVIALFYTSKLNVLALGLSAAFVGLMVLFNRLGLRPLWIYVVAAIGAWAAMLTSGIHATIAGILVAFTVPVRAAISPQKFFGVAKESLAALGNSHLTQESMVSDAKQRQAITKLGLAAADMMPPGIYLEHHLHPFVSFVILPLFALFSAGVAFDAQTVGAFPGMLSLGIIFGLVLGKPIGILLFSWLAIRSGHAEMPEGVSWLQLLGAGILAGIGFTMSIFVSELAFTQPALVNDAKVGIFCASLVAGVLGYLVLGRVLPPKS